MYIQGEDGYHTQSKDGSQMPKSVNTAVIKYEMVSFPKY